MPSFDQDVPQFNSFIMAGYECTYAQTEKDRWLDMLHATQHDIQCSNDYTLIKQMGITTVREGLSWRQIDLGNGVYDFSRFEPMLKIGADEGIQQIWDLNHFDYPPRLNPFSPEFIEEFAAHAQQAIKKLREHSNETLYIVPWNEISFTAWIGADMGWWAPFKKGRANGLKLKQQLVKAVIAAIEAIWQVEHNVRFIHVDPFMRRLAKEPANAKARKHVDEFNNVVRFEAWDMLAGKTYPELGGNPKYLDIIGMNYYVHNQEWVISTPKNGITHQMIDWNSEDRVPFAEMIRSVYERYHRPILISETGSYGELRENWWKRVLDEIKEDLDAGSPICGACIYPTLDRPEWAGFLLPQSGVWDFGPEDETLQRIPHEPSLSVIRNFIAEYRAKVTGQLVQ